MVYMIGANLSKMCVIGYNSYALNKIQQYRVAPPKYFFVS